MLTIIISVSCYNDKKVKDKEILQTAIIQGATLNISHSEWTAVISGGFGEIHLNISGSTNGDRVTIETHGDGLISEFELSLDTNKKFNDDIVISFTHAPSDIPCKYNPPCSHPAFTAGSVGN